MGEDCWGANRKGHINLPGTEKKRVSPKKALGVSAESPRMWKTLPGGVSAGGRYEMAQKLCVVSWR